MKIQITFITAILFFTGCENSTKDKENKIEVEKVQTPENETEFEKQMGITDNDTSLNLIHSLAYNNNEGSRIDAVAYIDKDDNEVKIEEKFSDVKTGNYGQKVFYIRNKKKYATKEIYFDNKLKTPTFVERISFYDEKEKVIFTKERFSEFEIDLPAEAFQISSLKDCSIDRTMRVLNQEGEFTTTFQGFVSNNNLDFLLVGENTSDGYASALAIQYKEGDIRKLLKNEKAMIGKPLEVQHEVMVDERGQKFQLLLSVKIK
jgi:hypothetical protein